MLSIMMLSLLMPVTEVPDVAAKVPLRQDDPPVKLWLSKRNVRLGDRVSVDVRTESDGYLLVLHAEPDGRVRVLFPIDPIFDNFVRGGDEFEIRGRGDREAFRAYASSGVGTVYAAFSRDPFQVTEFVRGDHWDYMLQDLWYVSDDAEAELTDLVIRMASGTHFDYDVVQYGVGETVAYGTGVTHLGLYADPYWGGSHFSFGIHWGHYYDPWYWSYGPWSRWSYLGWGYYDPWYDPWYYDPFYWGYGYYNPYSWRYRSWYYGGVYTAWPRYRTRTVLVFDGDHLRTTTRLTPSNATSRSRRVYAASLGSSVRRLSATSPAASASRRVASTGSTGTRATDVRTTAVRRTSDVVRSTPTRVDTDAARRTAPSAARPAATVTREEPQRRTPTGTGITQHRPQPDRQATPARETPTNRTVTPTRQVTPTRSTTSARPATPTRQAKPDRSVAPARSTPAQTRQAQPARSSVSQPSRSAPSRSATTTSRPVATRSAPVRSAPAQSAPARSAPVRSSAPSVQRSAPAAARPSSSSSSGSRPTSSSSSRTRRP